MNEAAAALGWAAAIEATTLARMLRGGVLLYPAVNAAHVVGLALLFGAIVPLDLRLLGCWRGLPLAPLARAALPVAIGGLVLAVGSGALLFVARATDYVDQPLFIIKLALLLVAVANALWLHRRPPWRQPEGAHPLAWRLAGAASIVLWLAVIVLGRWIGYQ